MLTFPVSASTFKRSFLGGDGQLEISSDQDGWRALVDSNREFDRSVDRIADVKFVVNATNPLKLGRPDTLKIGVSVGIQGVHQIQLIWPDTQIDPSTTRGLKPAANQLLLRLLLQGKADASVTGSVPLGPLKSTFGVTAGGSVGYERLKIYPATTLAKEILVDAFAGIRLPQQVDSAPEIPSNDGEVLVTRFGGYLTVNGQVSYGYSITGTKEIEIGKLNLDLDYRMKLAAGLTAGFRLAGEFDLEARAGTRTNFVRFVVRKSRESSLNFAADFGFDAGVHLKGMPDTSDDFLAKAFGTSVESTLGLFNKVRTFSNLDELEKAAGTLAKGAIHDLSQSLIGKALTDATLSEFLSKMLQVVDGYNKIDSRIVHLYEDSLARIPELTGTLDRLAKLTSREALKEISGNEVWGIVNRLAGPQLYDILLNDTAFGEFVKLIKDAKSFIDDGASKEIRNVVQNLKNAFPLDALFQQLRDITTPDQLKNLADVKLQGLAETLLNRTFEEIKKSKVGETLNELHQTIEKVATFKEKYYKKLIEVTNRSYCAQLHFAYARASSETALLDVEIDVSSAEGQSLARAAAGGDFAKVLARYNSTIVRINKGVFTHSVASSTQLQINLFGFGIEGMTRVFQNTDEALEAQDGGLLHIYTTKTQLEERHKHGGELTTSCFMLASVAKAFQPAGSAEYLIRTLPKMSVQYDFLKEDNKTKPDEMQNILELAELLEIVNAAQFTNQLRTEFPNGLGKVSAKYIVRYDSEAVASAFQIKDGPKHENLRKFAIDTMRMFISAKYTAMPQSDSAAVLGFAYASPDTFEIFQKLGFATFSNSHIRVSLPSWFTKGSPVTVELSNVHKAALATLYDVERNFVDRLVELDTTIDGLRDGTSSASAADLQKKIKRFVEMADDLSFGRENSFFIVFDRLVLEGSGGKVPRNSALVLEITPSGGEKVTKFMTGAKPVGSPAPFVDAGTKLELAAGGGM
jgi:hypothetical protein